MKVLRTDETGKFMGKDLRSWAADEGFVLEFSSPNAHQQNGVAERVIPMLRDGTMATLEGAQLSTEYWPFALHAQVWARNRTIRRKNLHRTSFEQWFGFKPSVASARIFGCVALYYLPREKRLKHEPKAKWGVYVGHSNESKAWLLLP